ncbi:MAG TPA: TetR/AcrR family transcriptional regulator [Acidimicrobiales bacterium]|nr:TetR/AcrR family transcriptional regulator [Acidimicrobiales bacterium]
MPTASDQRRLGRPPLVDGDGRATAERLLAAAAAACAERGFEAVTLADVARRAGVSAPAIYNHYGAKAQLLVAAGRWALDRLSPADSERMSPRAVARAFLEPSFAETRRLILELHLAGQRHPDVAELVRAWNDEHAAVLARRFPGPDSPARVATFFALLLGLCHLDSLGSIGAGPGAVQERVFAMVDTLFPEEPTG